MSKYRSILSPEEWEAMKCSDCKELEIERDKLRAALVQAREAMAPCCVGWEYGPPIWAAQLQDAVYVANDALNKEKKDDSIGD